MKTNIKRHSYIPPHNILSPGKEELRKEWIKKYHREGYSVKDIAKVFYTMSSKKIKEIIRGLDF